MEASEGSIRTPRRDRVRGSKTRGGERRRLLLQTTLRLIAERGIDAVNHRSVAEAAGVPLGSTTYWFASRQDMLQESLADFVRAETAALHSRLDGVLSSRISKQRLVEEFTAVLVPQLSEDRWRTVAQYTLLQEASRRPELRDACREWTLEWINALTEVFASLGAEDPGLEARLFLAMLDGLLIGELADPDPDVERSVIRPALKTWFARIPVANTKQQRRGARE